MIDKLLIFLTFFIFQSYFGQETLSRKDRSKFKKAVRSGDKEDYGTAIDLLTELIIENQHESKLYSKRGTYYYSTMDYQRALLDFNEGIILDYSNYESFILRWSCYYSLERYDEALADLKILLTFYKENSLYHYYIAGCYEELNEFQLAVSHLDTALVFKDNDSDLEQLYLHRGYSKGQLSNYQEAIVDFTKALSINDTNSFVLKNRSYCYRYLNQLDKATKDMKLVLENDSLNPEIYNELAIIEALKESYESSVYFDKKAISLDSSYFNSYINLSRVYLRQEEFDKAKNILERCPLDTKYLSEYYLNYAIVYKELGEPIVSRNFLEKGLNSEAEIFDSFVFNNLGFEFEEIGEYKKALKAYNKSLGMNVNFSLSYNNRANVKFILKDFEGACRDWNKALEKGYVYDSIWKEEYGIEDPKYLIEKYCSN